MKFNLITLMPESIEQGLQVGVVGQAYRKGLFQSQFINPRGFTEDVHQTVDDRPFGGGDGMVMMVDPLQKALHSLPAEQRKTVFYLSPQGPVFDDALATELSSEKYVTLICGRYSGVDQRFLVKNQIRELSIGNFVLSGGELAAQVVIDSVVRKIPGVLGHAQSAVEDSFAQDMYLEAPLFTRPRDHEGMAVPSILLEGNHAKIQEFRKHVGLMVTLQKRPELLKEGVDWRAVSEYLKGLSDQDVKVCGLDRELLEARLKKWLD